PAALAQWLGGPVVEATTQPAGFSPGAAARVRTADGRRVFVKAVGPELNPDSPDIYRQEARIVGSLPATVPVPRLLWTHDQGHGGRGCRGSEGRHSTPPRYTRRQPGAHSDSGLCSGLAGCLHRGRLGRYRGLRAERGDAGWTAAGGFTQEASGSEGCRPKGDRR